MWRRSQKQHLRPIQTLPRPLWSSQRIPGEEELNSQYIFSIRSISLPFFIGGDGAALVPLAHQFAGPEHPYKFVAAVGTLGIGSKDWDGELNQRYERFLEQVVMRNFLKGKTLETVLKKIEALQDPLRDGVGIPAKTDSKVSERPVTLLIDSKALAQSDPEGLRSRLRLLPEGSLVVEFGGDILSPLMRESSGRLRYSRRASTSLIDLDKIDEHTALLFSDLDLKIAELIKQRGGVAFQYDPASLSDHYISMLKQVGPAVLGEVAKYAKLPREVRDRVLEENHGFFGSANGSFTFLELWIESRASDLISASA